MTPARGAEGCAAFVLILAAAACATPQSFSQDATSTTRPAAEDLKQRQPASSSGVGGPTATFITMPTPFPFVIDQTNLRSTEMGAHCVRDQGSMWQSFTPSVPVLAAVQIRVRSGTAFEETETTLNIRGERPDGPALAAVSARVPAGKDLVALFLEVNPPVELTAGEAYFLEWVEPAGDPLQWLHTGNTYPGGIAGGCLEGLVSPEIDMVFATYTLRSP